MKKKSKKKFVIWTLIGLVAAALFSSYLFIPKGASDLEEEKVHPSDDSHFPTREDFHEYKKQRTKKVRNPLFTTLAIIFP
ncbi:hypothetical protein V7659_24360, partial [Neobacillus drentensis]